MSTAAIAALIEEAYRLFAAGRAEDALASLDRAVAEAPDDPAALNARGMVRDSLGRHDPALQDFERVLAVAPDFADGLNNRGIHYARVGQFGRALACYERSLAIDPDKPQVLYNRATAHLSLGDWLRGFREFEVRWQLFPLEAGRRHRLAPVWLGQCDVAGKIVLLHHEQGYGDTLQFCRYVSLVMQTGAQVILAVPAALSRLMQTLPGGPRVIGDGSPIPRHDYCCSLMSLAHVFCTRVDNVPAEVPYLHAEPAEVNAWATRLGAATRPRIGLVWTGRRYPPINYARDMSLDSLAPLLELPADFVCLQADLSDDERRYLAATPNVVRYGDTFRDFADTAALIENLDLVITVDTAVAHLAGALGKPVWVMNRHASCWRWMQERPDSPWYPSLRLFRQPAPGDWTTVVRNVRDAAQAFVADRSRPAAAEDLLTVLNAALAQHRQGNFAQAVEGYRRVLACDPQQPDTLHFLGIALAQQNLHEQALPVLAQALQLQPLNAALHTHYGNALTGLARYEDALHNYDQALSLDAALEDAHYNRGIALTALGRRDAALESFARTLEINPNHARAHNNRGNLLLDLVRQTEALSCYERAMEISPDFGEAWINYTETLRRLGRADEALVAVTRAVDCVPEHPEAHNARGAVLASMGRYEEALTSYQHAAELDPTLAEPLWNMAIAHLSRGEFREGWRCYEARWRVKRLGLTQHCPAQPPWLGEEPVAGKTVLLHAEQGYGDTIQFCRYAPLLVDRGARVVLGVPGALRSLMTSLRGVHEVVAQGGIPPFDLHCPLLSLPLAFGTELSSIPAAVPYLRADPGLRAGWARRLGSGGIARVGLVWAGSPSHTNDVRRSIPLTELLPLARCAVRWVCLQKEVRATDAAGLESWPTLLRAGEDLTDFAATAALIAELDLVIAVDTAVAHLAGALGKPVWILLPHVADWRWMRHPHDSPWYPSARLFRQPVAGDWASVVDAVGAELRKFVDQRFAA